MTYTSRFYCRIITCFNDPLNSGSLEVLELVHLYLFACPLYETSNESSRREIYSATFLSAHEILEYIINFGCGKKLIETYINLYWIEFEAINHKLH